MLRSVSFSIVLQLVLLLPYSVVGSRSLQCATTGRISSSHTRYDSRNLKQRRILSTWRLGDDSYNRMIPLDHPQPNEEDQTSAVKFLHRLRGGDATGAASSCKVGSLIEVMDIFGTIVFAFSGALKAGRKGMDLIGMMIIACITAVGGGTLRDVLMMGGGEEHVVFWMQTPLYIEISLLTALVTFVCWPKFEAKFGLEADSAGPICTSGKQYKTVSREWTNRWRWRI